MITEADTCRKYVLPKLYEAGWTDDQINEQKTFTGGRIVVVGDKVLRRPQKRADYLLRYTRDFMLAVIGPPALHRADDHRSPAASPGAHAGEGSGYAVDNGEHEEGVRCVAAPVRNQTGQVVASLSVSGPATRITTEAIPRLAERVKEVAAKLSAQLGYRG